MPPAAAALPEAAKTKQPRLQRAGNAPLSPPAAVLPPKGETTHYDLCVASLLQIMFAVHPSGGSTAAGGDRGAFPTRPRRGLPVFPARQGGFKVLSKMALQAPTTTLGTYGPVKPENPPARKDRSILRTFFPSLNLLNLLNPLNPRGVSRVHHKKYLYALKDKIE